jgi:glycosyltransferase involved in cell wall biosynthesis
MLVDRILVPSEYLRRGLLGRFRWIRPDEVEVIPNSKRLGAYESAGSGSEHVVFGVTSQLSRNKGHTHLVQALGKLRAEGVPARLRIAGTGPLDGALRAEASSLGLGDSVEFCGFQTDVAAFLKTLDAYVLPSFNESFSNAVLEAMCAGLPIVAFAAGGVPEVVGEAGLLIPAGDVSALAAAMRALAADPPLRVRLGRAARERAEERFDLSRTAGRLEAFLQDLVRR